MQSVRSDGHPLHAHAMPVSGDMHAHCRCLMHPHVANRLRDMPETLTQAGVVVASGFAVTRSQVVHRMTLPQEVFQER